MQQQNELKFATTHLSAGVRLHYAERGDPPGEAVIFLHGYSDSWCPPSDVATEKEERG
jgi:pimeloyl-ACP methyl ester carboxylesterase